MKHWNEVPEDHYELLKKRILEAIISYAMGPKIVLNRLCITVSELECQPNPFQTHFAVAVSLYHPHDTSALAKCV